MKLIRFEKYQTSAETPEWEPYDATCIDVWLWRFGLTFLWRHA